MTILTSLLAVVDRITRRVHPLPLLALPPFSPTPLHRLNTRFTDVHIYIVLNPVEVLEVPTNIIVHNLELLRLMFKLQLFSFFRSSVYL
jgi:hypothetical protein